MQIYLSLTLIFIISNYVFCLDFNVIELNHDLGNDSPYFLEPAAEPFNHVIIDASNTSGYWMAYGKFRSMEHHGTFVVAPYALYKFGRTVDQIPLKDLFGEACVIDIRDKVANNDLYKLSVEDVINWVEANGVFANNSIVLINTGWEKGRYPNQLKYFGDGKGVDFKFPGISHEAMVQMLSYEKSHGINLIAFGIDTPSINTGGLYHVGRLSCSLNKYGIRNMRNLDCLPTKGARLIVAPIKIRNGAGGPARVFALLPN